MTTDPPTLDYIPHDDLVAGVEALARALEGDAWRPDYLVGVGRGGLVPATYLSHRTGVPMLSVDLSARVADFADALIARLAAMCADGRRILLVDDINDSGATILRLRAALATDTAGDGHRFAVLIDNSRSAAQVDYRARTIDRQVDRQWFVFPWEAVASRAVLIDEALEVPERLG